MTRFEVETLTDEREIVADDWNQNGDFICFWNRPLMSHNKPEAVAWFNVRAVVSIKVLEDEPEAAEPVRAVDSLIVDYDEPVPIPKLEVPLNGVEFDTTVRMPAVIP